jgi:hypothetical protein
LFCCRTVSLPIEHDDVGKVDWDNLQIIETIDDEGRLQVSSDEQLYVVLGLKGDDERADKARKVASKNSSRQVPFADVDFDCVAIVLVMFHIFIDSFVHLLLALRIFRIDVGEM